MEERRGCRGSPQGRPRPLAGPAGPEQSAAPLGDTLVQGKAQGQLPGRIPWAPGWHPGSLLWGAAALARTLPRHILTLCKTRVLLLGAGASSSPRPRNWSQEFPGGTGLIPGPGTSVCRRCGPQTKTPKNCSPTRAGLAPAAPGPPRAAARSSGFRNPAPAAGAWSPAPLPECAVRRVTLHQAEGKQSPADFCLGRQRRRAKRAAHSSH